MNQETQDILFDLLTKKAIYGLDEAEQRQLDDLDPGSAEMEFCSLEITAAAISMVGLDEVEPMPAHLRSKIADAASQYVVAGQTAETVVWPPSTGRAESTYTLGYEDKPSSSWFGWLGWAAAAAACVALVVTIWSSRQTEPQQVGITPPPVVTPQVVNPADLRSELLRSANDAVTATWAAGNMKGLVQVVGDIVWSDQKQAGYMRLSGLPVNDATKETYQLWIYDKTRDPKYPIDGGTFDVTSNGEVVVPINAKLKAQDPETFAITVEKPGGVVVSEKGKIAALATVETKPKPRA